MSSILPPHWLQHVRLPCPSLFPRDCSDSCALSQWLYLTNHITLCHPILLLLSIFSSITVFSNESALHIRWSEYWSFSISPSNEYSGLISFRIDWFDLLAVQRTLKSLLQHHNSKASILRRSVFFMVQLSHPYMTTGKTIAFGVGCQWFWSPRKCHHFHCFPTYLPWSDGTRCHDLNFLNVEC